MPTIPVYLKEKVYWKVAQYASLWDLSVGKAAAKIIEKGLEQLDKEKKRWRKKGVIA